MLQAIALPGTLPIWKIASLFTKAARSDSVRSGSMTRETDALAHGNSPIRSTSMIYALPSGFDHFIPFLNPAPIYRRSSKQRAVKLNAGGTSGWRAKDGGSDSDY